MFTEKLRKSHERCSTLPFVSAGSPSSRQSWMSVSWVISERALVSPASLQLQNSKAVIQSKDSTIQELKEKIAYLEAEVCVPGSPGKGADSWRRNWTWGGGDSGGVLVVSCCCSEVSIWGGWLISSFSAKWTFSETLQGLRAMIRPVPTLKG